MKRLISILVTVAMMFMIISGMTFSTSAVATKSDKLYVGFGRANVTPRDSYGNVMPVTLAGYPDQRIANKILTDLYASCTAVRDAQGDIVLLFTIDSLHPYAGICDTIRAKVSSATGVPSKNILITATHNHSAPDINEGVNDAGRTYINNILYNGFVEAGNAAISDLALCTELYAGTLDGTGLNFIRRYVTDAQGNLQHEIDGDHTMPVVKFVREGNKKDIILANWAAHTDTVVLQDYYAISGDFHYYFTELAEQSLNAHVSMFNGASGDVVPFSKIESENTVTKSSSAYGRALANVLINNVSSLKKLDIVSNVQTTAKVMNLEVDHTDDAKRDQALEIINLYNSGSSLYETKCKEYGITNFHAAVRIATNYNRGATETMDVSAVSIGNIAFAMAAYEMLTQTSMDIKENSDFDLTFTCGYTNGHNGYIPPEYAFANAQYEVYSCRYIKGTAEQIQSDMSQMIDDLYIHTATTVIGPLRTKSVASVRISFTKTGLRFKTMVDKASLNDLIIEYGTENVSIGTLITPADILGTNSLTHNFGVANVDYIDVPATVNNPFGSDFFNNIYAGSIINIKEGNLDRDFVGVGYIKVSVPGSEPIYYYSDAACVRNVSMVAAKALADVQETQAGEYKYLVDSSEAYGSQYSPYTAAQRVILNSLIRKTGIKDPFDFDIF